MTHPYQPSEEILRLAREAGLTTTTGWRDDDSPCEYWEAWPEQLERFAMLVAQRVWISVDDRLPEKNTEVLVAFAGQMSIASTGQYTSSPHDVSGWCYPHENRGTNDDGSDPIVTHWQPLPEVPAIRSSAPQPKD